MAKSPPLSQARIAEIRQLVSDGKSAAEVARLTGVSEASVYKWGYRPFKTPIARRPSRQPGIPLARRSAVFSLAAELRREGLTWRAIGERLGVADSVAHYRAHVAIARGWVEPFTTGPIADGDTGGLAAGNVTTSQCPGMRHTTWSPGARRSPPPRRVLGITR